MGKDLTILSTAICCEEPERLERYGLSGYGIDKMLLPAAMRRRTSLTTRMAVTAATQACRLANVDAGSLPSVFASVGGEIQVTDALCKMLPDREALLSPTQFHNSVHNTTAGYWSILNSCQAATSAIAAIDDTFAMGLLEAWSQLQQQPGILLLVCYDEQWPQYLAPPMGSEAFACGLVLSSAQAEQEQYTLSLPESGSEKPGLDDSLINLIQSAPAAAAIPLLQALRSKQKNCQVTLNINAPYWLTQLQKI